MSVPMPSPAALEKPPRGGLCPNCRLAMVEYAHAGVLLDLCQKCHGLWFDAGELRKVEDITQFTGGEDRSRPSRPCARCSGRLHERLLGSGGDLRIDECGRCGGVFLDAGELRRIRSMKAQRRRQAAEDDRRTLREFAETKDRERDQFRRAQGDFGVESATATGSNLFAYVMELPVEEDNTLSRRPYVTYSLCAAIAAVWLWQLSMPVEVWRRLATVPGEILAGRDWWTLVASSYIHGGWLHVLGNLYFLATFADNVEDRIGSWTFLGCYVIWGLAGSVLSVMMAAPQDLQIPSLGASDAISGALGAYIVLFPRQRIIVRMTGFLHWTSVAKVPAWAYLGFWIGMQFLCAAQGIPGVGWWAHIGGFGAGVCTGLALRQRSAPLKSGA